VPPRPALIFRDELAKERTHGRHFLNYRKRAVRRRPAAGPKANEDPLLILRVAKALVHLNAPETCPTGGRRRIGCAPRGQRRVRAAED